MAKKKERLDILLFERGLVAEQQRTRQMEARYRLERLTERERDVQRPLPAAASPPS